MTKDVRISLLARVARAPGQGPKPATVDPARPLSILAIAAASFGARPSEDATVPTGFDPVAVALFESIVEGAYLVANADGLFDDEERRMFERVVVEACGGAVASRQVTALVSDLRDQLEEDGLDHRVEMLARCVTKPEQAREVLRIAALIAQTTDGVSAVERAVLESIAGHCGLPPAAVNAALDEVKAALASAGSE
jgi:tellurite resistance protein